ncbi:hypothetical protein K9L16_02605 [Candidatus Pacearchaeota archaeon]|nr:hypothetical protein [Candidatus Pacearchaeota archaeon]
MTQNKIIASIAGTVSIVILFIIFSLIFYSLASLTEDYPQAQAVLESGQEATQIVFNGWLIVNTIGGIILFIGLIFGVVKLVMKIAENECEFNSGGIFY